MAACGSGRQDSAGTVGSSTAVTSSTSPDRSWVTTNAPTTAGTGAGSATTLPVLSVPEQGSPPDEVILTCDGAGATLSADTVLTSPDGVHLTVRNTSGEVAALNLVDRGEVVPPGETATVQDMPPRTLLVSCGYDQNRVIVAAGTVEVVDLDGNWRPTTMDCSRRVLVDWGPELMGVGATPEAAVRWWAANRPEALAVPLTPDDEVVLVGYPEARAPRYVSRRGDQDTNIFRLGRVSGGWSATPNENCPR